MDAGDAARAVLTVYGAVTTARKAVLSTASYEVVMGKQETSANRRRDNRIFVEVPGSYRHAEEQDQEIVFGAISISGCRLNHVAPHLGVGDVIALNLGPIGPLKATIRWVEDGRAGAQFHELLEEAIVDYFAVFCGPALAA